MAAEWTLIKDNQREECASASHDRPVPADWRMDAGDVGSYYCETCRYMIMSQRRFGDGKIPITTTPLQQAIDKARGGTAPTTKRGFA